MTATISGSETRASASRTRPGRLTLAKFDGDKGVPTVEEERALAKRIQAGDAAARDELVTRNLRLVSHWVHRMTRRSGSHEFADLFQEGVMGLCRAAEEFRPEEGVKFNTYASYWVRNAIMRAMRDTADLIRTPKYLGDALAQSPEARSRRLAASSGRSRLAQNLAQAERLRRGLVLRDWDDQEGTRLTDLVVCPRATADAAIVQEESLQELGRLLDALEPREREVLERRFGLREGGPETFRSIAPDWGVSWERVRQIEKQAIERLRKRLREE